MDSDLSFDPDSVRASLPPLDIDAPLFRPEPLAGYYRFYDLDLTAEYAGLEQRIGALDVGGERICVQLFRPLAAAGTAIVSHGYYDHTGIYGHLIRFLLDRNLCVLAFDQPGHGLSSGPRATIESFDRYVDTLDACVRHLADRLPEPWHLVGQSMGGSVAVEYLVAGTSPRPFGNVVLLAPLVRPANWPVNRVVYRLAKPFIESRPRVVMNNSDEPGFVDFIRRDPLQPMVLPVQWVTAMVDWMQRVAAYPQQQVRLKIIQGERDGTVDYRFNIRALARAFQMDVLYLPEGRHHLVNSSPAMRQQMWHWLDGQCDWR